MQIDPDLLAMVIITSIFLAVASTMSVMFKGMQRLILLIIYACVLAISGLYLIASGVLAHDKPAGDIAFAVSTSLAAPTLIAAAGVGILCFWARRHAK